MTRATFGVSASCFAANMAVKQNPLDFAQVSAQAVESSFYVDDGLTGADDVKTAITLRGQLCDLFARGGFVLRKWNSSDPTIRLYFRPYRQTCGIQRRYSLFLTQMVAPRLWV